ncbi:MAG TPA: type I polyketide synthase [Umezawaea sp.]
MEAQALLATYGQQRDQPLLLGSVKSNIGHTQAAAGVAGVIKSILALRNGIVPPTLHVDTPTPHVDWTTDTIRLTTTTQPWPENDRPRRAAVSSFGISGTNAHLILEQAPHEDVPPSEDGGNGLTPWVLSARTAAALRAQASRLVDAPGTPAEVARSLVATRSLMPHRAVVFGRDREQLVDGLRALEGGGTAPNLVVGETSVTGRTAFLFSGQGAQRLGMGRDLAEAFPVFRSAFDEACAAVDQHLGRSLRDVVWGTDPELPDSTEFTQPGLFAFEVALHRLLLSWGVTADHLAGHSIGEIAAVHAAGVLSLADAAALVVARGRLMREMPDGVMVSVRASEQDVVLEPGVWIAAVNGPESLVLSGDEEPTLRVVGALADRGIRWRRLRVARAFHSGHVDAVLPEFADVLAGLSFAAPRVPVVSSVTGRVEVAFDAAYWLRQAREPVRFGQVLDALADLGVRHHLEVGPSAALTPLVAGHAVAAVRDGRSEAESVVAAAAELHVRGVGWDATAVAGAERARVVDLPTYAFQPERFWWPADEEPTDSLRHHNAWRPLPSGGGLTGRWVLVTGGGAIADRAERALVGLGADVTVIAAPEELGPVLDAEPVRGVLSLLALGDVGLAPRPVPDGLLATKALVDVLVGSGSAARLWCATSSALSTWDGEPVANPVQAVVWGLGRVVAEEHPAVWGGLVDLPEAPDDGALDRLASVLTTGEDQVAVRASGALARRLVPAAEVAAEPLVLAGTALVTGGTGALGGHVARWLANRGAEHLLLLGRRGTDAPGVADLVDELRGLGVGVSVVACDVADRDQLAAAIAVVPEEHPLTAVVHAAGVLDDGVLGALTPERFAGVLGPKARAAAALHELTEGFDLRAFILFSSFAGSVGAAGQANYAAANAHLDALAEHRRARGLPATAVAWGPWAGGGMAADDAVAARMERTGVTPIRADDALAALDRSVTSGVAATVVVSADWDVFAATRSGPLFAELVEPVVEPVVQAAAVPLDLDDLVRTEIGRVLGLSDPSLVEPHKPLRELGFDSLTSVELRNRLAAATGLVLPTTVVFDHPTAAMLARMLRTELSGGESEVAEEVVAVDDDDPVVIVGMACRLPGGVTSPEDLWDLVVSRGDGIVPFPADRGWDVPYDESGERPGSSYVRVGGFLDDVGGFDADFFGISPREALAMDPQQRLFLEVSWEVLERAGIDPTSLRGSRTGVFAGINGGHYASRLSSVPEDVEGYLGTGNSGSVVSGRVSYAFGLEGPALTVDTACSSSLVTIDLAAQSLRRGECSLALAGGVSVMATPEPFVDFSRQRGLAPDGLCKSFGAGADGTAWGEGVGVLVLERLSDARREDHRVLAVVRASAVNQDGASNGLTAPNGSAQQRVIRAALASAGLSSADVDVVEGHGTGTRLGDPIEVQALLATYGQERDVPLLLGSVKSNIGHTQAAAGVAGVIKAVLALRHGVVPGTLNADEPSPHVDWSSGAVAVASEACDWPAVDRPRRAGVSSFGISGTNAHVILEQAREPEADRVDEPDRVVPWVFSARTADALRAQAARLAETAGTPAGVARSLVTGRAALPHRAVVVGRDRAEIDQALHALAAGDDAPNLAVGTGTAAGGLSFLFSGQGSQRLGMGRGLADAFPVFRRALDETAAALTDVMWGEDEGALDRTEHTQPALFAVEVALFRLLESLGVRPDVVAGHSIGEIAAAHVAGVLSLEDAGTLVSARGRLMQRMPDGAMVSVRAPESDVVALLRPGTWIAAVNGPSSVVVSGDEEAVLALAAESAALGFSTRRLRVDRAFHSGHVDALLPQFAEVLAGLSFAPARLPIVSSVTGKADEAFDAEYWLRQAREPVRFGDVLTALGTRVHLEVGPGSVLTPLVTEGLAVPALRSGQPEDVALLTAVGALSCAGVPVDWTAVVPEAAPVDLPTYPFQHQRFWLEEATTRPVGLARSGHPVLTSEIELAGTGETVLTGVLSATTLPWAADHVLFGEVVAGGGLLADLALHAASVVGCPVVDELRVEVPLVLPEAGEVELQVRIHPEEDGAREVLFHRRGPRGWTRFAAGTLGTAEHAPVAPLDQWPPADAERIDPAPAGGLRLGPAFRPVAAWSRGDEVLVELDSVPVGRWDSAWHAVPGLAGPLVTALRGLRAHGGPVSRVRVTRAADGISFEAADATGTPVASIASVEFAPADRARLTADRDVTGEALFRLDWAPLRPAAHPAPDLVVHPAPGGRAADAVVETVALLRGWLTGRSDDRTRLVLLTRHGVAVDPAEEVDPDQAALWGLVRSAQTEHPDRFTVLDTDGPPSDDEIGRAVGTGAPQLALRAGKLFAPSLVRAEPTAEPVDLGDHDTVLITGGTGGLGALLARHLVAERGVRHLVLVSRRGPAAPGAPALHEELTALGAEVSVLACDVADRAALADLLATVDRPVTAVVHAAGVTDDGAVLSLDRDRVDPVLRAKTEAALHFKDLPGLRLLVFFSSASGVLGGPGQGNYAAANAFLDAVAHEVRRRGGHAVSQAWGLWSQPDGLGGRLSGTDLARMAANGMLPLDAADGLALFDRTAGGTESLVQARLDLAGLRASRSAPFLLRDLAGGRPEPEPSQVSTSDPNAVRALVRTHTAKVLGHTAAELVDADRGFLDLGLDSLTAVELRNRLDRDTGLRLPATVVFDHPTPNALADHLTTLLTPPPTAPLTTALDDLEAALTAAVPEPHDEVADRLSRLLRLWTDRRSPDADEPSGLDLSAASLGEVLDFIDSEFSGDHR